MGGQVGIGGTAPSIPDDWWDPAFRTRVRIDIDNSGWSSSLSNFPVALRLSGGAYDSSKAGSNGRALRFVDDDHETELAYEIERGATLEDSTIWVRIPEIQGDPSTESFWLYYDNDDATPGEQVPLVWSNGYVAVYHLNGNLDDSTAFAHDGTTVGAVPSAGQTVGGYELDLTSTPIDVGTSTDLANIFDGGATVSGWMNPADFGPSGFPRLLDKSLDTTGGSGWALQLIDATAGVGYLHFEHGYSSAYGQWRTTSTPVSTNVWQSFALSYDSTDQSTPPNIYHDGAAVAFDELQAPLGTQPDDVSLPLYIGERSGAADRGYDGNLDEIRISNVIRTADWLAAEHRCMSTAGCAALSAFSEALD